MDTLATLLMTLLMFVGIFLIGLILLQRGRGGGLAGAFGGMGGQSAFGTKAGDVFTRITIGVATVWILLCAINVIVVRYAAAGSKATDSMFKQPEVPSTKKAAPANEAPPAGPGADTEMPIGGSPKGPAQNPDNAVTQPEKPKTEEKLASEEKAKTENDAKPQEPAGKDEPKAKDEPKESKPEEDKPQDKPADPPK